MTDGPRARRSPAAAILGLCAVLSALAVVAWIPLFHDRALATPRPFGILMLAVLFAAAEATVVHVHVRRHAHSFSITEAPLVLALVFFAPPAALIARLLGSFFALVVIRRQQPIKVLFNLALFSLDAALIIGFVRLSGADPLAPRGWAVVLVAALLGLLVGSAAIGAAIALTEGKRTGHIRSAVLGLGPFTTALGTGCGLIAAVVLQSSPAAWILLVSGAGVVAVSIRAHADLRERHQRLERAYDFTTDAVASLEDGRDRIAILERACDVLRAEWAELTLASNATDEAVVVTNRGGVIEIADGAEAAAVVAERWQLLGGRASTIVHRHPSGGFRRAVVAAIPGRGTLLVADRLGDVDRFDDGDRRLLETLASQAALIVRNRALLDRLRQEVADRHHRSLHDPLTELPNRVLFAAELERALAERAPGSIVAVLLADLDRFKEVNDTLGHQQGDRLLKDVARRIRASVPEAATVARLGGDEFAVLLPGGVVDSIPAAEEVARRLLEGLVEPFPLAGLLVDVGASVGIAACPHHADEPFVLLQRADVAMYAAKAVGTGVAVYDPADDWTSKERLGIVAELRAAIERKELYLEFQPIIAIPTGDVVGAEALCRWYHPVRGRIGPDEFIPIAESSGLIGSLTLLVLELSLRHLRRWRDDGHEIGVSVNLSARNLVDETLPASVANLLHMHDIPPSALTLEVTESSILADPSRSSGVVGQLAAMGVRLSIDDFGTGYSSLSKLQQLPVDEVKIDRSFLRDLPSRREHLAIVKAITDLARALDLEVTAEGVEDGPTLQLLAGVGCHHAQGFHVARPLSPALFDRWLRRREEEQTDLMDMLELPTA